MAHLKKSPQSRRSFLAKAAKAAGAALALQPLHVLAQAVQSQLRNAAPAKEKANLKRWIKRRESPLARALFGTVTALRGARIARAGAGVELEIVNKAKSSGLASFQQTDLHRAGC